MDNKLFVASLSFKIRDEELTDIFSSVGSVVSAKVILDRDGRSKGFGFVEMSTQEEAEAAITKLNGTNHFGRAIVVNKQKPQAPKTYTSRSSY
ncbi:MAG: putative RNA-binding protein [Burkholderiales bacterium]|jgi:RNA recognition motif-containing protein|nr:putative RNA-binding protein [Burkholderiales bacterium]